MGQQIAHYEKKLQYGTDSWDLYKGLSKNENITVIDARSPEAYEIEHIPSAIDIPHRSRISGQSHAGG